MQAAEIELKIPVHDPENFRRKVEGLGFRLKTERSFEQNTLYDTPERSLRLRGQILRLREYCGHTVLTHKRQPENCDPTARYKTRIETETVVEDGSALVEIFAQLGCNPVFSYEKFRTEWVFDAKDMTEGHLVVDETPIGIWAELEGEPAWIDAMLEGLGVLADESTTASYGRLFVAWKAETGSPAENMTFAEIEPALVP